MAGVSAGPVDPLVPIRNLFYTGAYQTVINETSQPLGPKSPSSTWTRAARQLLLHRSQVMTNRANMALPDLPAFPHDLSGLDISSENVTNLAMRLLAELVATESANSDATVIVEKMDRLYDVVVATGIPPLSVTDSSTVATPPTPFTQTLVILATCYVRTQNYDRALTLLHRGMVPPYRDLECIALFVQVVLIIRRFDVGKSQVEVMKKWADDATLAQLVEAWTNMTGGGPDKYNEAFYTFEELCNTVTTSSAVAGGTTSTTCRLLTSKAVCLLLLGRAAEAEQVLLEALNRDPYDVDTLANMATVATVLQKPASVIDQYLMQARESGARNGYEHAVVSETALKESLFDRCAARYAIVE